MPGNSEISAVARVVPSPGRAPQTAATRHPHPLPFRWLLPVGQLLMCSLLLLPFRGVILFELLHVRVYGYVPDSGTTIGPDGKVQLRTNPAYEHWAKWKDMTFDGVSLVNLPGAFVALPSAIFSSDHREWTPARVEFKVWRAVSWPFLAVPFWWIAGRGVEALLAAIKKIIAPRLRWWETLIAALLLAGGITCVIGFVFFAGVDASDRILQAMSVAFGFWAVLGGVTVVAKFLQWRLRRNSKLQVG